MRPCIFCEEQHWDGKCHKCRNPDERFERLKALKACFKCFKSAHTAKDCQIKVKCFHCGLNHNSALCRNRQGNVVNNDKLIDSRNEGAREVKNVNVSTMVTAVDKVKDHGRTVVFLMCREVTVVNSDTGQKAKAIALFDSGSQSSFITKKLAEQMEIPMKFQENLIIENFGARKPVQYNTGVVETGIRLQTEAIKQMKLKVLDSLTSKLQCMVPTDEVLQILMKETKVPEWG